MAIAVGDILQITDQQSFLGETLLNVYFYEMLTADPELTYEEVKIAFQNTVIERAQNLQSEYCSHIRVIIKNLTNALDIAEYPIDLDGVLTGTPTNSFTALSFRFVRTTALTRHGSKRIGGLDESVLEANGVTSGFMTAINAYETQVASILEMDSEVFPEFTAQPVIVGRILEGNPGAGELDLTKINPVASIQYIRVTSQATRRQGRGV